MFLLVIACRYIYGTQFVALLGFVNKITYIENRYLQPLTPRIVQQGAVDPHQYADKPRPNWKWPCTCFCGALTLKLFWLLCPVFATFVKKRISGVGWMKCQCTTSCPTITHSWNSPLSAIWCQQVNVNNVLGFFFPTQSALNHMTSDCARNVGMYLRWLLCRVYRVDSGSLPEIFFLYKIDWKIK